MIIARILFSSAHDYGEIISFNKKFFHSILTSERIKNKITFTENPENAIIKNERGQI